MSNKGLTIFKIILCIMLLFSGIYFFFLYAVPEILNSQKIKTKTENFLKEKAGINLITENLYFKTYPDLSISINADSIFLNDKEQKPVLRTNDLELFFDLKRLKLKQLNINHIYIDEYEIRQLIQPKEKNKNKNLKINLSYIPDIRIKNAEIWIDRESIKSVFINIDNINIYKPKKNRIDCTFEADIISDMMKNLIHIGNKGFLYFEDNNLYAKNLEVTMGQPKLVVDGLLINNKKHGNFTLKGKNLPVNDIESSLLYFLKLRKPGKQFLENFRNFDGNIDIDLEIKNWGFFGQCSAKNLKAESVLFNVPIIFKEVFFKFNDREINSEAAGTLGGEKVYNTFKLTNMASDNQEVTGHINSLITNKLTSKYISQITILGGADATVDYRVKNRKINVDYLLELKKDTEIIFNNSYLGIIDKDRKILVNTTKDNDKLYIDHYEYSLTEDKTVQNIITGDGLFIKKDGHFTPDFITCKTNGYVPVTIAGSFGKVIEGGVFDGDIRYDYKKNLVTGDFTVKDTAYKSFYVENAKILADEKNINIEADGEFKNSPFKCRFNAENGITDKIHIYDMQLMLDEFLMESSKTAAKKFDAKKAVKTIKQKARDIDLTIEKWTIQINKIKRNRIELKNILLAGSFENNIFGFVMSNTEFAKGILYADGIYNMTDHSAEINFRAENIDSDSVAGTIFGLHEQIRGIADSTLHLKAKNNFKDIDAYAEFKIKQGYLPKLGSTEFIIKKSKKVKRELKFKISDILNIDIKNMKAFASDLEGSFYVTNEMIRDAFITSRQKYLSVLIEGDCNTETGDADLNLYGKYNKTAEKKIKVFFVPLSWIVNVVFRPEYAFEKYKNKIEKIPPIDAEREEEHIFRVKLSGDLNDDDIHVEMKRILKKRTVLQSEAACK